MTLLPPNTELVAVAWLASITGLSSSMVATTLPADPSGWAATGFVTVGGGDTGGVVGGQPEPYGTLRSPVLSLHSWATKAGSAKPPWWQAAALLEYVAAACSTEQGMHAPLTLPSGYARAQVQGAYLLTEPRRLPGDPASYAHYQADLILHWVSLA